MKHDKYDLVKLDDVDGKLHALHIKHVEHNRLGVELTLLKRYKKARKHFRKAFNAMELSWFAVYKQKPELIDYSFSLMFRGASCFAAIEGNDDD